LLVLVVLASTLAFGYALFRVWVDLMRSMPEKSVEERDGRPPSYCSRVGQGEVVVMENRLGNSR